MKNNQSTLDRCLDASGRLIGWVVLAVHLRDAFRMAGVPLTPGAARAFLKGLPPSPEALVSDAWRRGFTHRCLERAFQRTAGTASEARFTAVADFFLDYLPTHPDAALHRLLDLLSGVSAVLAGKE